MTKADKVLACPKCGTEGRLLPRHYIDEQDVVHEDWSIVLCLHCDQTARLPEVVRRP